MSTTSSRATARSTLRSQTGPSAGRERPSCCEYICRVHVLVWKRELGGGGAQARRPRHCPALSAPSSSFVREIDSSSRPALLLRLTEYVVLAILAFPFSFQHLGMGQLFSLAPLPCPGLTFRMLPLLTLSLSRRTARYIPVFKRGRLRSKDADHSAFSPSSYAPHRTQRPLYVPRPLVSFRFDSVTTTVKLTSGTVVSRRFCMK